MRRGSGAAKKHAENAESAEPRCGGKARREPHAEGAECAEALARLSLQPGVSAKPGGCVVSFGEVTGEGRGNVQM